MTQLDKYFIQNPEPAEHLKDFYMLQRVTQKINSILDTEELLNEVIKDIEVTFGYSRVAILFYNEEKDELTIGAVTGWSDGKYAAGDVICKNTGIVWKVVRSKKVYYSPDIYSEPDYVACDPSTKSEVNIPLFARGKFFGILNIQNPHLHGFSSYNIHFLELLANHISIAMENARLFEFERKEKELIKSQMLEARKIQKNLFPNVSPKMENFNIEGICIPCSEVGGDWYDYFLLEDKRLAFLLADVSGKGLGASLLMSSTRSLVRMLSETISSPAKLLMKLNQKLCEDFPATKFVTMIFGVLDPPERKVTISIAGHSRPLLLSKNKTERINIEPGLPLGITASEYFEKEIVLKAGESILLYTDGVTEAMNDQEEEFGEKRLEEFCSRDNFSFFELIKTVSAFSLNQTPEDDLTLLQIHSL